MIEQRRVPSLRQLKAQASVRTHSQVFVACLGKDSSMRTKPAFIATRAAAFVVLSALAYRAAPQRSTTGTVVQFKARWSHDSFRIFTRQSCC